MQKEYFFVRYHRENFEYYAGHGMRKDYESPDEFVPLSKADLGFVYFRGYIYDDQGTPLAACSRETSFTKFIRAKSTPSFTAPPASTTTAARRK